MAIINCDSLLRDKTHCDLCADKLKIPCWGWFGFQHVDFEIDKEGEAQHLTPFDLVLCLPCSSKIAYNIISDMKNAVQDYRKAADYIESMPIMPPVPSVNAQNIKNN